MASFVDELLFKQLKYLYLLGSINIEEWEFFNVLSNICTISVKTQPVSYELMVC